MGKGKAILSKASIANLKKTYYYLKKNGLRAALFAVGERLEKGPYDDYKYESPSEEILENQRNESFDMGNPITISILVPAYNTAPEYMDALLDSVCAQTYPYWELIIADASEDCKSDESVAQVVRDYIEEHGEERIRYVHLPENAGISNNTNCALEYATGEFTALLDHDDLLTPDALYENAVRILNDNSIEILYSDEDKCDETGEKYYEVYKKPDFNLGLLMSNNYICHFTVMKTKMMQKLQFRCNFDGSQDYDLILRGVLEILPDECKIAHIPQVLYHWRCHSGSTAVNPQSKLYAYEAGQRALEDFLKAKGWNGVVTHTNHLGFFKISYEPDIFEARNDVGVVGGRLIGTGNKIAGGIYDKNGECPYEGLRKEYGGYMHQAVLSQDAYAVDIRCMRVRPELYELFEEITGVTYAENQATSLFDSDTMPRDTDWVKVSMEFCKAVKEEGYRVYWTPELTAKIK